MKKFLFSLAMSVLKCITHLRSIILFGLEIQTGCRVFSVFGIDDKCEMKILFDVF